jgi:transposase InsO family protein
MSRAERQCQRLSPISRASEGGCWFPSDGPPDQRHSVAGSHRGNFFHETKGAYGWPRAWRELLARGKRKFTATTNSSHRLPVSSNLLEREFCFEAPNRVWTGDITYLWTEEGRLYLAVVTDLFSRHVVGFSMSERMTRSLVIDAITHGLVPQTPSSGADLSFGSRQPIRQRRLPEAALGLRHVRFDGKRSSDRLFSEA